MDSNTAARGSSAPGVAVGTGCSKRGAGTATDTGIATDGDCGSGMDGEVQGIDLCAAVTVCVTVSVVAGRGVSVSVPGVTAAFADGNGCPGIVAPSRYGYGSAGAGPAAVAPYRPNGIVVVSVESDVVGITGGGGVGYNGAAVALYLIPVQRYRSIFYSGFYAVTKIKFTPGIRVSFDQSSLFLDIDTVIISYHITGP